MYINERETEESQTRKEGGEGEIEKAAGSIESRNRHLGMQLLGGQRPGGRGPDFGLNKNNNNSSCSYLLKYRSSNVYSTRLPNDIVFFKDVPSLEPNLRMDEDDNLRGPTSPDSDLES